MSTAPPSQPPTPPTRSFPSRDPRSRSLLFAVAAPALPALALVVAGAVLYNERLQGSKSEVREQLSESAKSAVRELDQRLSDSEVRLASEVEGTTNESCLRFFRDKVDSEYRFRIDAPPTKSVSWPPEEVLFVVPELARIEQLFRVGELEPALESCTHSMTRALSSGALARFAFLRTRILFELERFQEAADFLDRWSTTVDAGIEVDGLPVWLTVQSQRVRALAGLQQDESAKTLVEQMGQSLLEGSCPLPTQESGQHALHFADAVRRELTAEKIPAWLESLPHVGRHLESLRYAGPGTYFAPLEGQLWAIHVDRQKLNGCARSLGDVDAILSRLDSDPAHSLALEPSSDATDPWARWAASDKLGSWSLVARGDASLAERIFAPWKRAILSTLVAVLAIAGFSAFFAARSVRRQLAFATMKEQFVASISHELRTPLSGMLLQLDMLEDQRTKGSARKKHLDRLRQGADRLRHLIDHVLQFSKSQSALTRRRIPVNDLLRQAQSEVKEITRGRELNLILAPESLTVEVDPPSIVQVLIGLVDNALKYTSPGEPITLATTDGNGIARVSVEDRGPGIGSMAHESLFEPFVRGDSASSKKPGVGLGLAIAKRIVEANGGRIRAEAADLTSAPNPGLRIVLEFDAKETS